MNAYEGLFGKAPVVDKWTFSTNGVSIMGRHGIPVIGFGPGKEPEKRMHLTKNLKSHLVTCAAMYAAIPLSGWVLNNYSSLIPSGSPEGFWSLLCAY